MANGTSLNRSFDHIVSCAFGTRVSSVRTSFRSFLAVGVLLFAASAAVTIFYCTSMSAPAMPMPGGWTISMAWTRMPGQSWLAAAGSFVGMWLVMMIAMMLPSIAPVLWRYRYVVRWIPQRRRDYFTIFIAAGYFFVWAIVGIVVFVMGATLASVEMHRPALASAVPYTASLVVLVAGLLQFTHWKTRQLACCREAWQRGGAVPLDARTAWKEGLHLGVHCTLCCAGLTAVLVVGGIMNVALMAIIGVGITLERLAPASLRVARVIGVGMIVAGLVLIARTVAAA